MSNSRVFRTAKWLIIILAAGIAGVILGSYMMRYETRLLFTREYCGSFRGIDVYKCGEMNKENVVSHLTMLDRAPKKLTDKCKAIYFTGSSLDVPEMSGEASYALGLTQDSTIFITTDSFYADVLYHELFHSYDNASGKVSDSSDFRYLYEKERAFVKVDCMVPENDRAEFFAAAGAEYLLEPRMLEEEAPETYKYFEAFFDEGGSAW